MSSATLAPERAPRRTVASDLLDLLASMRFAIALLTVICIASAIGTVLQQGQAVVAYVDAFGPFWAEVFGALGLFQIYSSPWFLVILAFLVVSTSLCIARNTPKILADLRTYKEGVRVRALDAFHHKATGEVDGAPEGVRQRIEAQLLAGGWKLKAQGRPAEGDQQAGVMLAARKGSANKLGYIAAHSAIVLVCVGGLLDGDLLTSLQMHWRGLELYRGGEITELNRLSVDNPAYRAQLMVPEGQRSDAAVLTLPKGMLLQPMPFEIELKRFIVDYYATGMPKRFASDILIHDPVDGSTREATVEVNKPVVHRGITIFQSSFEDGGSQVVLRPLRLDGGTPPDAPTVTAVVGGAPQPLSAMPGMPEGFMLEMTGLRAINVEDLAKADGATPPVASNAATDVRGVNLAELSKHLGSGAKGPGDKKLVNIGPSVTYKLRDASGQAFEFQNYMLPVPLGEQAMFLLGVRTTPGEPFRFLRVPADENASLDGWLRLRQALGDDTLREKAVQRFVTQGQGPASSEAAEQLALTARRVLELYAGLAPKVDGRAMGAGFQALSDFVEQVVPPDQREATASTLIRILNGTLFELLNVTRLQAGQPALSPDDARTRAFMTQAVLSLSDAHAYPVSVLFMPQSFEQKQASVFQVTRTPGRSVVYLGCVLLIVGVLAMLYVRERRVWVWVQQGHEAGRTRVKLALSSTRQTLDTDQEFDQLRDRLLGPAPDTAAPQAASAEVKS